MNPFIEIIWKRCQRTSLGRFGAGFLIGALFGGPAALSISHEVTTGAIGAAVTGLIGGLAVLLLESRDRQRSATPEWKQRVEQTTSEIQGVYPDIPPLVAREAAIAHEEKRFTPWVWAGMAVALLSLLGGAVAFILKFVDLFRP